MTILLFFLSLKLLPSRTPTIQVRIPIQVFRLFLANKTGQEQNEKRLFGWYYNILSRSIMIENDNKLDLLKSYILSGGFRNSAKS